MKRPRPHPEKKTACSLYKAIKSFTSIDIEALKIDLSHDRLLGRHGGAWHRRAAFIFMKEARFTKTFIDAADHFSLCFFRKQYRGSLLLGEIEKVLLESM